MKFLKKFQKSSTFWIHEYIHVDALCTIVAEISRCCSPSALLSQSLTLFWRKSRPEILIVRRLRSWYRDNYIWDSTHPNICFCWVRKMRWVGWMEIFVGDCDIFEVNYWPNRSQCMLSRLTYQPTHRPAHRPTHRPTHRPSHRPTHRPTHRPNKRPTDRPTHLPTDPPTNPPTDPPADWWLNYEFFIEFKSKITCPYRPYKTSYSHSWSLSETWR